MGRSAEYSSEVKAAVMAALLAGQSIREVASNYKIPRSTVGSWAKEARAVPSVLDTKKEEIGDLLLDYIRASLESLKVQVQHFGDKNWLAAQDADALAVLHGVQTDKAIKLLEAIAQAQEPE
mgnify:FL=1